VEIERDCPFCLIALGLAEATVVRTWRDALAIVPTAPVVPGGHWLIIPVWHVTTATPAAMASITWRAAELMDELGDDDDAFNWIASFGAAATQTIPHLHLHLIRREAGDGLTLPWTPATTGA
jgi:histidine triad (HIT) family protein